MKESLNKTELDTATSIITAGLNKAAESLSFFMKEPIQFNKLSFSLSKLNNDMEFTQKQGSNIHLLITNVIGDLKGVCCLIFSEEEVDKLRRNALPPEIVENPLMLEEMSDAIMLEVDNIISASVITQFSNILQHKIYGGVPELKKFDVTELKEYVKNNFMQDLYIINFKTQFSSSQMNFNPEFVWLFDCTFVESVKRYAGNKQNAGSAETLVV